MSLLKPFEYQVEGAAWLAGRRRGGLHDEMGVGKTATAILALDSIRAERGIIVCPAMLRENWIREFRRFSSRSDKLRLCKGRTIHDYVAWSRGRYNFLITSYEQATNWHPHIMDRGELIDAIVCDESHFLKNPDAKRTKAVLGPGLDGVGGLVGWADAAWNLSGTPIPNDPIDIYPFLRFTHCMPLGRTAFMKRYFNSRFSTYGSKQTCKEETVAELRALINNNALRRTKNSIGMQLPPIFMTSMLVDGNTQHVLDMFREHPGLEDAVLRAVEQGSLSFIEAQHVATLRRLVGEAKAIPYAKLLYDELVSGQTDKRVVFGIHRDALEFIRSFLERKGIRCVIVHGGISERNRVDAVNDFQNDPECRVFIGNIMAAGTGLTLTAACELDMLESDWTPAGNAQAIMRIHRIGQERNVRARFIALADTIDETVIQVVADKVAAIAEIEGQQMHAAPS